MKLRFWTNKKLNFEYSTQYVATFIVSIGVFVEGMHYGWSSPSLPKLLSPNSTIHTNENEALLVAQMFTYGSLASTVASIINYPQLNQKITLLISIFVMTLSWVLISTAWSAKMMMVARFFAGVGRFLVYLVSIGYICEIAEPKFRGMLGSMVYIMMNLGLLVVYSVGPYVDVIHFALMAAIISLTELVALKWVPESPYFLIMKNKTGQARSVLKSLRSKWNVEEELDKLRTAVDRQEEENSKYWDCVTVGSNRKALIILSILHAFQVLSGVNISIHHILKPGGGDIISYNIATLTSITAVVSCTFSAFLLDVIGRKAILMISFTISGAMLIIYGCYVYLDEIVQADMSEFNTVPFTCLVVYTMIYRMGIGMVPLLLSGELFPMNVKNVGGAFCGILSVLVSLGTIEFLNYIKFLFGNHVMYWFYGFVCYLGIIFTAYFVPETKGLTLEEIQWKLKF